MRNDRSDIGPDFREEELSTAAAAVREAMQLSLDAPGAEEHIFSDTFQQDMQHLLCAQRSQLRRRTALRRVAAVFLVMLLGAGMWLGFDAPARAAVLSWVRDEAREGHMIYSFPGENSGEELPLFLPDWLPEGMVKAKEWTVNYPADTDWNADHARWNIRLSYVQKIRFEAPGKGSYLILGYMFMEDGVQLGVTNFADREQVTVNGWHGEYYPGAGDMPQNTLVWFDEARSIAFFIDSDLEFATILRAAESVSEIPGMPMYLPTWTPEHEEVAKRIVSETKREVIYRDPDTHNGFTFSCYRLSEPRNTEFVPEGAVWERVKVGKCPGEYYADTTNRVRKLNYLIWTDEKNDLEFCIVGQYDQDVLLKIAKSVKLR